MPETGTQARTSEQGLFSAQLPITVTARLDLGWKYSPCGFSRKSPLASVDICQPRNQWTIICAPRGVRSPANAEVSIGIGKPIPRLDRFLSRDRLCYDTNRLQGIGSCQPSQPPIRY
jgi:hypothetical protein